MGHNSPWETAPLLLDPLPVKVVDKNVFRLSAGLGQNNNGRDFYPTFKIVDKRKSQLGDIPCSLRMMVPFGEWRQHRRKDWRPIPIHSSGE